MLMFDGAGHFTQIITGSESRMFGPKSFASFGSYTFDTVNNTVTTHFNGCSNAKLVGTVQERKIVLLTISMLNTPTISEGEPIEVQPIGNGFYRVIARFGFMESPDVPTALSRAQEPGLKLDENDTTFYLADLTLLANDQIGMPFWRDALFIFLSRNARRATNFFNIPVDRVVEIGIQLEI